MRGFFIYKKQRRKKYFVLYKNDLVFSPFLFIRYHNQK
jgi:hypothetical protein